MEIVKFENRELHLVEDNIHSFLLTNKEVALGYGVTDEIIRRQKNRNSDELIEGKHFVKSSTISRDKMTHLNISPNNATKTTLWTKKGIVRLGFFIKSKQAVKFRDWAEDYILNNEPQSNELIKIHDVKINSKDTKVVEARDLHSALNNTHTYKNWLTKQIRRASLSENIHYVNIDTDHPQSQRICYITIDSAKHIAMLSQSYIAPTVRDYLREVENSYMQVQNQSNNHNSNFTPILEMMAKSIDNQSKQTDMILKSIDNQSKQSDTIISQNNMMMEFFKDMKKDKEDEVRTLTAKQISSLRSAITIFSIKRQEMTPHYNLSQATRFTFTELNSLMGVNTYTDIPSCEYDTAMEYIKKATENVEKDLKDKKLKNKIDMAKDLKELMNDMPNIEF